MTEHRCGIDADELIALLRLQDLPGLGPRRLEDLLNMYGWARTVLARRATALRPEQARALDSVRNLRLAHERADRLERLDVRVLRRGTPEYPERLTHLAVPPPILYTRGHIGLLEQRCIAIVGTRRCTRYGSDVARQLGSGIARGGVAVVSGLARGIDGIAHRAALDAGGPTIAVLGTGIDCCYPEEHSRLQDAIGREGLVVSEFPPGLGARKFHFPGRNRIIAALSEVVIVVEAGPRSGALKTAGEALDLGLDVYAVPGPIGREESAGTNALIRDGADILLSVDDALRDLKIPIPPESKPRPPQWVADPVARGLLEALGRDSLPIDDLAARLERPAGDILALTLDLELSGLVRRLPGLRFSAVPADATLSAATG